MVLVVLPEGGCWQTLSALRKFGGEGHITYTNDPKCFGFHSVKQRKVRDRSTSPEGRARLHLAAEESFVCGQELSCAKEGLYTMEDTQSATGFGGQLGNVAFPGKIMVDSETQNLERKDFFQRIVEKVDRSFQRDIMRVTPDMFCLMQTSFSKRACKSK